MTTDELQVIRSSWLRLASENGLNVGSPGIAAQAAADIERLVTEVQRLEKACHEITLQYARLCQRCSRFGHGVCAIAMPD